MNTQEILLFAEKRNLKYTIENSEKILSPNHTTRSAVQDVEDSVCENMNDYNKNKITVTQIYLWNDNLH